jgi:hypothetical protein
VGAGGGHVDGHLLTIKAGQRQHLQRDRQQQRG